MKRPFAKQKDLEEIQIPSKITEQLHDLVGSIARMHRNNPFYNFEHASHVVMRTLIFAAPAVAPRPPITLLTTLSSLSLVQSLQSLVSHRGPVSP